MRYAKWMAVLGLVALTGCGSAPVKPAPTQLDLARARWERAQEADREKQAAISNLAEKLEEAQVAYLEGSEAALNEARSLREELCRLDPSRCEAQAVLTPAPVVAVTAANPPELSAHALLLEIRDFSKQGVRRLPGSADWKVEVELDRLVHVYLPGGTEAAIEVEDCSFPVCVLPVCVRMDAHGEREAIDCPAASAVNAEELE